VTITVNQINQITAFSINSTVSPQYLHEVQRSISKRSRWMVRILSMQITCDIIAALQVMCSAVRIFEISNRIE